MSELGQAALAYAKNGWRVFPLHGIVNGRCTCGRRDCSSPGKHPVVRRGLHAATCDVVTIRDWWRCWRRANIGIATGAESGIVVIDVDLPAALASVGRLIDLGATPTLTGLTGGGGLHLVFTSTDDELGNSAGRLPGVDDDLAGVDLRANGGYIVAPPSVHRSGSRYEWLDLSVKIADAPERLRERPRRPLVVPRVSHWFEGDGTRLGLKVLRKQLAILASAREGERNHTLNRCAFVVAQYVAAGHLPESTSRNELGRLALSIGLTDWETSRTIDSAFRARGRD